MHTIKRGIPAIPFKPAGGRICWSGLRHGTRPACRLRLDLRGAKVDSAVKCARQQWRSWFNGRYCTYDDL